MKLFTEDVASAGWDVAANAWSDVFDFTPPDDENAQRNWILLEADDRLENFMSPAELLHCSK